MKLIITIDTLANPPFCPYYLIKISNFILCSTSNGLSPYHYLKLTYKI